MPHFAQNGAGFFIPRNDFPHLLQKVCLTQGRRSLERPAGHAVPTPRVLSVRRLHDYQVPARSRPAPFSRRGLAPSRPSDLAKLATESLGRSHRAKIGKTRLAYCIDLMREILQLPETHRIGIVPGSDTGAFEMAMWTMLGAKPVTTLAWESFGEGWVTDVAKQLKLDPTVIRADYGQVPDLTRSTGPMTFCSPGTAPPAARAFPTLISSPPTAKA
jgi:hypothetical protein